MAQDQTYRQYAIEEYVLREEPFYIPVSDEVELFEAAYASKIPVLPQGPTANPRGESRRHLLPGRDSGGAQRHNGADPPPYGPPARPPHREAGPDRGSAGRFPTRHLLQPGLPARPQGPEAEHSPAGQ